MTCWKDSQEWLVSGSDEDRSLLAHMLENRVCSSIKGRDVLAWDPSPKGKFLVAQGHFVLDRNLHGIAKVDWWKKVWNKFSWPKYNFF